MVLSDTTRLLVQARLPVGVSIRDLGFHRLKDLEAPERLYQLAVPGLPEQFPPLKSLGARVAAAGTVAGVHGFAAALTSFVGRAGAVDEVCGLLDGCRLVTVTGPGGVGKTRLATEAARRVAVRFADGACLVELAGVQEPALVPAAVAVALGIPQTPDRSAADSLAAADRMQVLLVLDNCEHIIGAAADLCEMMLPVADDARILATSQEPLRVAGEARYRLAPLSVPQPDGQADASESEAVSLFVDRAKRVDPHFELNPESALAVARLVARLDGMPLAMELAAARVEALGVEQLLDRLDDRFALLASGDRRAAARQRSLAATVDWSYQLLDADEQRVFRQLSVTVRRVLAFAERKSRRAAAVACGVLPRLLGDRSLARPPGQFVPFEPGRGARGPRRCRAGRRSVPRVRPVGCRSACSQGAAVLLSLRLAGRCRVRDGMGPGETARGVQGRLESRRRLMGQIPGFAVSSWRRAARPAAGRARQPAGNSARSSPASPDIPATEADARWHPRNRGPATKSSGASANSAGGPARAMRSPRRPGAPIANACTWRCTRQRRRAAILQHVPEPTVV